MTIKVKTVDHLIIKINNRITDLLQVTTKIMIMVGTTNIKSLHHFHLKTTTRTTTKTLTTQIKTKTNTVKTTIKKTKRETGKIMGNKSSKSNKILTKVTTKINILKIVKGNHMTSTMVATLVSQIKMIDNRVDSKMDRTNMIQSKPKRRIDKVPIMNLTCLQEKMRTNEIIERDRGQGSHLRIMIMIRRGVAMISIEMGMMEVGDEAIMIKFLRETDTLKEGEQEHSHLIRHITVNFNKTCIGIKPTDHHLNNNIKINTRIEVSLHIAIMEVHHHMATMEVLHHPIRIEDHHLKVTTNNLLMINSMDISHMISNMVAKVVGIIITINLLHMEAMINDVVLHHLCITNSPLPTIKVAATTMALLDLDITTLILRGWLKEGATQLTKDIRKYLSVDFQEI